MVLIIRLTHDAQIPIYRPNLGSLTQKMTETAVLKQNILELADHCVKCGLCSSQCPTYLLKQDENESPRGRIALAQALASDAIQNNEKISTHINNCLQCRRCEAACPSDVKYGDLINATNELLAQQQQTKYLPKRLINFISGLTHQNWGKIEKLYKIISHTGLIHFLKISKTGRVAFNLIPKKSSSPLNITTTKKIAPPSNSVFLFTGCLSHIFDKQTLKISIELLKQCGYEVQIPEKQTCCGAIAARQGLTDTEQQCQLSNQMAFSDTNHSPIIFFTTGCGSKLKEYKEKLPSEVTFANRTFDISSFLIKSDLFTKLKFSPLNKNVLIFNPCSERNILKQDGITEKLLYRIPDINFIKLPKSTGCCGASGSHLLTHSQQADQIRTPILNQILSLSPDIIVSPNYPCNLHIQAGLKEKGMDIPMIHPIELLYQQCILEKS